MSSRSGALLAGGNACFSRLSMAVKPRLLSSETQKRRSLLQRMTIVHAFFLIILLTIIARLMELQIVKGADYRNAAQLQHFGDVKLPAKRGEIFALNSKTGERNILATNTTQNLVYVDPLVVANPTFVAETLAGILVTDETHDACSHGKDTCPKELIPFYAPAFDPIDLYKLSQSGGLLEPLPADGQLPPTVLNLPDKTEATRQFARSIEQRISQKRVIFSPIKYGANKVQLHDTQGLAIPGIVVVPEEKLIYADPEQIDQSHTDSIAKKIGKILDMDPSSIVSLLRSRPLRYVPVMRKLSPSMSLKIREAQLASYQEAEAKRKAGVDTHAEFDYPLRSIALLAENWRFYPDTTIASHVVGFLNTNEEAQYGIERAFNPQLRGQEGIISSVRDLAGGQILTAQQTIVKPKDGDSIVLTLDRTIQKEVETVMEQALETYKAEDGQAIVMDPATGKIFAMVNVPLFDSNNYADVYAKEPFALDAVHSDKLIVEVYDPTTNVRLLKEPYSEVFIPEGRKLLSAKGQKVIDDLEKLYDLSDITRYYLYQTEETKGDSNRREVFPTSDPNTWLRFKNQLGVGAYLNRNIQSIYEPGSVMKPVTMSIALDQGELTPDTTYEDKGPVKVDEFEIKNALQRYYGHVTMTDCLAFSINTCMTSVSARLGAKLFDRMLERFGFGRITGIELEDELGGELRPWRKRGDWSNALLATTAFGQGISVTPLQMTMAFAALANDGKLMKPILIDRVIHPDGTEEVREPKVLDQVIKPETAKTITDMLIQSVQYGYAKAGGVKGYDIAGKTGTSQIAGPGGKYETGTGSTITSFIGYAPAHNPKFLIYVKFDRPKRDIYGTSTAVPVFHDIASFLIKYYGLPPEH